MTERVIIQDKDGREVSVPVDQVPRGAKRLRPDVIPGRSQNYLEVWTSEAVNVPEPEEAEVIVSEEAPDGESEDAVVSEADTEESQEQNDSSRKSRKR